MALDLIAELEGLIDALEAAAIPYALCGGLALAVHGHPRATKDIDLLIQAGDLERAVAVAKQRGFDIPARKMTFGLRAGAAREMKRVSKLDPETNDLVSLDLIIANPELEPVWTSREVLSAGSRHVTVVSRGGLVAMKKIAGRPQDLADIAKLEGTDDSSEG